MVGKQALLFSQAQEIRRQRAAHAAYQVSRLGIILLRRLPAVSSSDIMPFRPLHGYWDSPEITSAFP